jgi:phosphate transport system permease protein
MARAAGASMARAAGTSMARAGVTTRSREIHWGDRIFLYCLRAGAFAVAGLLLLLILQIWSLARPALEKFGLSFLTSVDWDPVAGSFGALAFTYGTVVSSLLALALAVPVSVGVALFLTEVAPRRLATLVSFLVEMLAAVPSVIYGLWGIFVLAPLLRTHVQPVLGKNLGFIPLFSGPPFGVGMMAAGIILAIMIIPTIASLSREVFLAIPRSQREAAWALGATRWEGIRMAVLKSATSGILGASVLGLGRALGETMAVTMVIGNRAQISASIFMPAQTMASAIANEYAEATDDLHLSALAAVGIVLFGVSFLINVGARALIWRTDRRLKGGR